MLEFSLPSFGAHGWSLGLMASKPKPFSALHVLNSKHLHLETQDQDGPGITAHLHPSPGPTGFGAVYGYLDPRTPNFPESHPPTP